jgi:Mlc titration factor MtfA (ptsG expression regulator)
MFRDWRRRYILRQHAIADDAWEDTVAALPFIAALGDRRQCRLRELTTLFLHDKSIHGAGGYQVCGDMALWIAVQACLPILELGLDWYRGWKSIVVYPGEFLAEHDYLDEAGVHHRLRRRLAGEASHDGPVVLSWEDAWHAPDDAPYGFNVIIHECAHRLDMLNGEANGMPPLHAGQDRAAWTRDFSAAFEDMNRRLDAGQETAIDPYAAGEPGEFFAVLSEAFFLIPHVLRGEFPRVYDHLQRFYRQAPHRVQRPCPHP